MKKFNCCLWVLLSLIGLILLSSSAFALQSGDFTYTVSGGTITITKYTGTGGAVVIPAAIDGKPVLYIGQDAFNHCSGLTSVTIPNSVTSIGYAAFEYCTSLTSVTIGNSVTSIGDNAFVYCRGLTSITIPDSITSIGNGAFYGCLRLTSVTIPDSVTSIGKGTFYNCSGLTSVTIGNSVASIGDSAFYNCTGLTSIVVDESNNVYSSQDGVLYDKAKTVLIQYPGGKSDGFTIPDSVTSIWDGAFAYCSGLTSVTIPDSVTSIGDSAFYNCTGLTSVTIGNSVASIGDSAFYHCTGLTSVTIPNSVTSIGSAAFEYCTSLTSVTIGNSVTSIGSVAFAYCSHLTSVTIGNSLTSIGDSAFYNCTVLTTAYFYGNAPSMGTNVFRYCASNFSVCYTAGATGFTTPTWYGYPAAICEATLIKLASFTTTPKAGKVILQWSTEAEIDNAGFNLYRSETENGNYSKINASLIAAKGSSTQGATYEFVDSGLQNRKTYYYKLEDIDLNGTATMHGPESVTPRLFLGIFEIFN